MKHPLTKSEITGLIFLVVLIVGITSISVSLKKCKNDNVAAPAVEIITAVPSQDTAVNIESADSLKTSEKKKKKKSGSKKKKAAAGKATATEYRDPFKDTVSYAR